MAGGVSGDDEAAVRSLFAALAGAWRRADGAGFAAAFTADADFVNIRGMAFGGREAIASQHQQIFDTIYRGSEAHFELVSLRRLAVDVLVGDAGSFKIAAFQNTVLAPPGT